MKIGILFAIFLILATTSLTYLTSLNNGFTSWDDPGYIADNPLVKSVSVSNTAKIFSSYCMDSYQPLSLFSYSLDYAFCGLNARVYHLTNLFLHLINCLLVFWLILLIGNNLFIAFLTAILFGIHPLNVETVAWLSERKGLLCAVFYLGTIISYLYYVRKGKTKFLIISLFLFILSLLSKAMAVTLPFILIIFDYFMFTKRFKELLLNKIYFFVLSLIFTLVSINAQYSGFAKFQGFNLFEKMHVASYCIIFYLTKIFFPVNLSSLYIDPLRAKNVTYFLFKLSPFLALILLLTVVFLAKYSKKLFFPVLFFLIALTPALQFIPVGKAIVADRHVYLACIGIFYIFSIFLFWFYHRLSFKKIYCKIILILVLILFIYSLAYVSYIRSKVWKDGTTLWSDVLNNNQTAFAYVNRGILYCSQGKLDLAILDYSNAMQIDPHNAQIYGYRAEAYYYKGNFTQAISDYTKAIEINLNYAEGYYNRASAYYHVRDYDKAWVDVHKAEGLGLIINSSFLNDLKKTSRREK